MKMDLQKFQVKANEFERANEAFATKVADDAAAAEQREADAAAELDADFDMATTDYAAAVAHFEEAAAAFEMWKNDTTTVEFMEAKDHKIAEEDNMRMARERLTMVGMMVDERAAATLEREARQAREDAAATADAAR